MITTESLSDYQAQEWEKNPALALFPPVSSHISEAMKTPVTVLLVAAASVESGSNFSVHHSQLTEW